MSGAVHVSRRAGWALIALLLSAAGPVFAQAPTIEECDARVQDSPEDPASYYCYVLAANASGLFDEAAGRLEEIRRLHPERQRSTLCLASIRHAQGRPETESLYRDAIAENQAAGDVWGEVYARSGLGRQLADQRRLDEADEELAMAAVAAETLNDTAMLANVLARQAVVAFARLDYGRALKINRKAETLVFPEGPAYLQSWVLSGLGSVYWAFGDYRQAMSFYGKEAELARNSGDLYSAASVRWNMALMVSGLEARHEMTEDDMREALDDALQAAIEGRNRSVEASCRAALGQLLDGSEAIRELEKAQALSDSVENVLLVSRLLGRATYDLGPERREEGLEMLDAAIRDSREGGSLFDVARGQVIRASLVRDFRPEQEAIEAGLQALDGVEQVRIRQPESHSRALVFSQWGLAYDSFVDWLLDSLHRSEDPERSRELALAVMERRRSRELLEHLEAAGASSPSIGDSNLATVRQALAPDQMLLSYQIWERSREAAPDQDPKGGSWLMAITKDEIQVIELPGAHRLAQQVAVFAGLLENRDGAERSVAGRLYKDLLGEALRGVDASVRRLVIVPDGPLHSLPFAALRPSTDEPPLADTHILSFAPSVKIWMRWQGMSEPLPIGSGVLSMADPDLASISASPVRAANPWAAEPWYGALPHARRESRALVRSLGAGQVLSGAEAAESWLKSADLASFPVLHFAAHTVVDTDRPERSAILLATGGVDEDGLLHMREIVDLDLSGRLVLLSGCRSATGSFVQGEGVMGLSHAFFQSGARAIIGSLWPLRDEEAADLVSELAQGLAAGHSVDEALAGAQQAMIRRGAPEEVWAGVVVLGDGGMRLAVPPATNPAMWWLAGLIAAIAVFFLSRSLFTRYRLPPSGTD